MERVEISLLELGGWQAGDGTGETRPEWRPTVVNSTHLPDCGLKIVVRSFSMASKKSVKAFAVSTLGFSFELELSGAVAAGVDDAYGGQ